MKLAPGAYAATAHSFKIFGHSGKMVDYDCYCLATRFHPGHVN